MRDRVIDRVSFEIVVVTGKMKCHYFPKFA